MRRVIKRGRDQSPRPLAGGGHIRNPDVRDHGTWAGRWVLGLLGDPRQPVNLPLNTILVVYTGSTLGPAYEREPQGEPPVDPSVSGLLFFMYREKFITEQATLPIGGTP